MQTPYFPNWRSRLAALGRRAVPSVRQATPAQLQEHLRDFLPAPLLCAQDQGPNSRDRVFSLRLTFECFVWQMLKPKTSCRGSDSKRRCMPPPRRRTGAPAPAAICKAVRSRSSMGPPSNWQTPPKTRNAIPNPPSKKPAAAFRS